MTASPDEVGARPREGAASHVSIAVHVSSQRLVLCDSEERILLECSVSTARKGVGEQHGSEQTPRGLHTIRAKIGASVPAGGIFVGRRFTREVLAPESRKLHSDKDWILTRILWLGGLEPGRNRFGLVDTFSRYIYLHGCPDDCAMGVPLSHGCVRMRSRDIIDLFERVRAGTPVVIHE